MCNLCLKFVEFPILESISLGPPFPCQKDVAKGGIHAMAKVKYALVK